MLIVGLTGGIASGKSVVADMLAEKDAIIIDADRIAHQVVKKNMPAWQDIVDAFGRDILREDGEINRKALGKIIFSDQSRRDQLNHIVHPRVFEEISRNIALVMEARETHNPVIILDIPLLFETRMNQELSDIIVVYVPEEVQLERLLRRDEAGREDAMARIRSQIPIEEKKRQADYVIDNSGPIAETRRQVEALFAELQQKAENSLDE
ncbi:MAG: dephospho-CoA kinase [Desulfosudaceae bacterium]